jgi:hypothetical protein
MAETEHLDIRFCVRGEITSSDADLLDSIESELPDETDVMLGTEYSQTRVSASDSDDLDVGQERISARMTFTGEAQEKNGQTVTPKAAANDLIDGIIRHDLAGRTGNWEIELYRTPEGGVRKRDVREWYQNHPEEQPDGDVPTSWNPEHHVDRRETPGE